MKTFFMLDIPKYYHGFKILLLNVRYLNEVLFRYFNNLELKHKAKKIYYFRQYKSILYKAGFIS